MCYNISAKKQPQEFEKRFGAAVAKGETISAHYYLSGFNHPKMLVIASVEPNIIHNYNWGLIPAFCKTVKDAKEMMVKTLNAKTETVFALPSFKNSIRQKRCMVLADGFYEWRTLGKLKYPYFIRSEERRVGKECRSR